MARKPTMKRPQSTTPAAGDQAAARRDPREGREAEGGIPSEFDSDRLQCAARPAVGVCALHPGLTTLCAIVESKAGERMERLEAEVNALLAPSSLRIRRPDLLRCAVMTGSARACADDFLRTLGRPPLPLAGEPPDDDGRMRCSVGPGAIRALARLKVQMRARFGPRSRLMGADVVDAALCTATPQVLGAHFQKHLGMKTRA